MNLLTAKIFTMPRTCLIFKIQLSPADLQLVRNVLLAIREIKNRQIKQTENQINQVSTNLIFIMQDLTEIILESKVMNNQFNAFILKMAIVKLEHLLSIIQLSTTNQELQDYDDLQKCYLKLVKLFTGLIEAEALMNF